MTTSTLLPHAATTGRAHGTGLPYLPGLDGLRAVSVVAVLLYHYRPDRSLLRGGFLGVEVFFVISGYLITSLLLAEVRTRRRVDLRHFWVRRIRRLWPALIAMMLMVGLVVVVFYHEDLGRLRGDLAFGFYGENWWHIVHGVSYVDIVADAGRRQPFQHLWSLAVEEQFYVVWPLVFTFGMWVGGLRRLRAFTIALAMVSWMAMVWFATHGNQNHAYLGTEARAFGPLSGAILAFLYPPRRRRPARSGRRAGAVLDFAGFAALAGLAVLFLTTRQNATWLYVVGFVLTDLCTVVLIVVIVSPIAGFGRAIGTPILRWIGLRSYGIYLWGIAVFEFTRPGLDVHTSPLVTLAVRVVLVMAIVELSYRYIETPVRSGAFLAAWNDFRASTGERRRSLQRRWRLAGVAVLVATTCVGAAAVASQPPDALQLVGGHTAVGGGDCVLKDTCRIPTPPTVASTTTRPGASTTRPLTTRSSTTPTTRGQVNSGGWKVSAVGDSVLLGAASAVETTLTGPLAGGVLVNAAVSQARGHVHPGAPGVRAEVGARAARHRPLRQQRRARSWLRRSGDADRRTAPQRDVRQPQGPARLAGSRQCRDRPRCRALPQRADLRLAQHRYRCSPQNVYFYRDGYHLTPVGRTYYAQNLYKALRIWHWARVGARAVQGIGTVLLRNCANCDGPRSPRSSLLCENWKPNALASRVLMPGASSSLGPVAIQLPKIDALKLASEVGWAELGWSGCVGGAAVDPLLGSRHRHLPRAEHRGAQVRSELEERVVGRLRPVERAEDFLVVLRVAEALRHEEEENR